MSIKEYLIKMGVSEEIAKYTEFTLTREAKKRLSPVKIDFDESGLKSLFTPLGNDVFTEK